MSLDPKQRAAREWAEPEAAPLHGPELIRLSEVKPERVRWLWRGRIPLGKLTIIAGDPGKGKSLLTLDVAARTSTAGAWPDGAPAIPEPGGVVLVNIEDDFSDTIAPRLIEAGADLALISGFNMTRAFDESGKPIRRAFTLADVPDLESAIHQTPGCKLVVIDPLGAFMGRADSHRDAEVRGLLAPLGELASRTGAAIVIVAHLNKSEARNVLHRVSGSGGFIAAARMGWLVERDPDDAEDRRRFMLPLKANIAASPTGLAFRTVSADPSDPDHPPRLEWERDPVQLRADDLLTRRADGSAFDEAMDWLRDLLCEGPVPAKEVKERAKADGIAFRTLDRAKAALKIKPTREGFASDGRWLWYLPDSAPPERKGTQPGPLAHNGESGAQSTADGWGRVAE